MSPTLVLTTVNASHSKQLDAHELAYYLKNPAAAVKAVPGHMWAFFGDVEPTLQLDFASQFKIAEPELVAAAKAFAAYSGASYPLAA